MGNHGYQGLPHAVVRAHAHLQRNLESRRLGQLHLYVRLDTSSVEHHPPVLEINQPNKNHIKLN